MSKLERNLVQKVPLFFGFKPGEMKTFLNICKMSTRPEGEILCEYNTASSRLFILLEGVLDVVSQDGTVLASIDSITTVGEMGFISHKPRSATVRVRESSRLLRVGNVPVYHVV